MCMYQFANLSYVYLVGLKILCACDLVFNIVDVSQSFGLLVRWPEDPQEKLLLFRLSGDHEVTKNEVIQLIAKLLADVNFSTNPVGHVIFIMFLCTDCSRIHVHKICFYCFAHRIILLSVHHLSCSTPCASQLSLQPHLNEHYSKSRRKLYMYTVSHIHV